MQLTYTNAVAQGFEGQVATAYPNGIVTGLPNVAVRPGKLVTIAVGGSNVDQSVAPPAAAGDVAVAKAAGIVILEHTSENGQDRPANRPVGVMRKGQIWMLAETAMVRGTNPFVRHVAAGAEILGSVRNDADGTDATVCTGLKILQTITAGGLVLVEVNL